MRVGLALAVEAGAAGNVVVQDHTLAFPKAIRPGPERHHRPRDLVAEDAGWGQEALLDLLEVRTADAAGLDPDEHLARARLGARNLLHPKVVRPPIHDRLHLDSLGGAASHPPDPPRAPSE